MPEWNKERLEQMIADGVEERASLDYKGAGALAKSEGKKKESDASGKAGGLPVVN